MSLSNRFKAVLVMVLTGGALYLATLNLADRLAWKQRTDNLEWAFSNSGLVLRSTPLGGLSSSLKPGDQLLDINGLSIRNFDDYVEVVEVLTQTAPTVADYTFRQASGGEVTVPISLELRSAIGIDDAPLLLVAIVFLFSGLFIFIRSWESRGAFHFYLMCQVAFLLLFLRHSGRADTFDAAIYWCSAVAFLLLPPLFLHFCCYFPRPLPWFREIPQLKPLLYGPFVLLLLVHVVWFLGSLQSLGLPRSRAAERVLDRLELFHLLVFFGAAVLGLWWARRHQPSRVARKQMLWITNGTLAGVLPFALVYCMPFLLGWPTGSWQQTSVLSLALIPLSFGYAITKHRLMDVHLIFKRGAAYALASSFVLACYVAIALLIATALQDLSPQSGILLLAFSALVVAFLFAPLRETIQEQIDRYFYRDRYAYRRSFAQFARTLASEINLPLLTKRIADRIQATLDVSPVGIFVRNQLSSDLYELFTIVSLSHAQPWPSEIRLTAGRINDHQRQPLRGQWTTAEQTSEGWAISYLQPLRVHGRLIGFLAIGDHPGEHLLSSEDRTMLATLADYAAIAIDNAILYRSLEKKAAELSQLKLYNENVIESITLGVAVVSPEGKVTVWNSAISALTGIRPEQAIGNRLGELLSEDLVASLKEVVEGPGWQVQSTMLLYKTHLESADGTSRRINLTLAPFLSKEDVNTGTLIILDDVTDKVRLENQLLQAEKLSSIGLFAAGLAHEVNTPLTGISSYSQLLLEETPPGDPKREFLEKIERQSFRAAEIINNLLNFARFSESTFEELNLNSLMTETLSLLRHQFRKGAVEIELDLAPDLPPTVGNGGKLQQVFMNLFLNAKDAMPNGGTLRVKTYDDNGDLIVEFKDTGSGISKEDIQRIYDPFFTTKEVGKGTGLGLSICYGIIQEHSGRITVDSRPGEGTIFTLQLPLRRVN